MRTISIQQLLTGVALLSAIIFLKREKLKRFRYGGKSDHAFHCVNVAQGIKTPITRYQADPSPRHLQAVKYAFADIEQTHGQPHGLYGGDEGMHGTGLTQGSDSKRCRRERK